MKNYKTSKETLLKNIDHLKESIFNKIFVNYTGDHSTKIVIKSSSGATHLIP